MKLEVGDLVRHHVNGENKKTGVIVRRWQVPERRGSTWNYEVYWDNGKFAKHVRWQLSKVEDK
tara:strand:+ start:564 stop:752 length:189 start_codon:yes stop_codon:yes gene_type:complete